jgi:hypothetical protein
LRKLLQRLPNLPLNLASLFEQVDGAVNAVITLCLNQKLLENFLHDGESLVTSQPGQYDRLAKTNFCLD